MFPIIELSGGPKERGLAHGRAAAREIAHSIGTYAHLFAYCGIDWKDAQQKALKYVEPISAAAPELLTEIEGIAEGSGRKMAEILALNARTELLPSSFPGSIKSGDSSALARNKEDGVSDWLPCECTIFSVSPSRSATGNTLLAQNWDWMGTQRAATILLRHAGSDDCPAFLLVTEAGILSKFGLNEHGLGVAINILRSLDDGQTPAMPVHCTYRWLLSCRTVDEARVRIQSVRHGASTSILCADAGGTLECYELSPQGVGVLKGADTLGHTNHFITTDTDVREMPLNPVGQSIPRLDRLHALIAESPARFSVEDAKVILRDETLGDFSICRSPAPESPPETRSETVTSGIMELAAGRMHIAPDIPTRTNFVTVSLKAETPVKVGSTQT